MMMVLYRISEQIGQGATGDVFVGECEGMPVSIKVIHAADPLRVISEAEVLAKIPSHDNVVPLCAVEPNGPDVHLVREWVNGVTLSELIRHSGRISFTEAIHIARCLLCGLAEAVHPAGVVHCDLSPANILIAMDGAVRITDFGISSENSSDDDNVDQTTFFRGTLPYTSPEQAMSQGCDARSDLFAVGVILYELLTGRPPFIGTPRTMLHQLSRPSPISPPKTIESMLPHSINNVVRRLLAKKPDNRYQSAQDALDELSDSGCGRQELAVRMREISVGGLTHRPAAYLRGASVLPMHPAPQRRPRWILALIAGFIGAGVASAGFVFWLSFPQPMQMAVPMAERLTLPETRVPHESPRIDPPSPPRRVVRVRSIADATRSDAPPTKPKIEWIPDRPYPKPKIEFISDAPASETLQ